MSSEKHPAFPPKAAACSELMATSPGALWTTTLCLCSYSDLVMEEFLNCAKQTDSPVEAIKLVKLAVSLGLPSSQKLKSRVEKEFELSENQK